MASQPGVPSISFLKWCYLPHENYFLAFGPQRLLFLSTLFWSQRWHFWAISPPRAVFCVTPRIAPSFRIRYPPMHSNMCIIKTTTSMHFLTMKMTFLSQTNPIHDTCVPPPPNSVIHLPQHEEISDNIRSRSDQASLKGWVWSPFVVTSRSKDNPALFLW